MRPLRSFGLFVCPAFLRASGKEHALRAPGQVPQWHMAHMANMAACTSAPSTYSESSSKVLHLKQDPWDGDINGVANGPPDQDLPRLFKGRWGKKEKGHKVLPISRFFQPSQLNECSYGSNPWHPSLVFTPQELACCIDLRKRWDK